MDFTQQFNSMNNGLLYYNLIIQFCNFSCWIIYGFKVQSAIVVLGVSKVTVQFNTSEKNFKRTSYMTWNTDFYV